MIDANLIVRDGSAHLDADETTAAGIYIPPPGLGQLPVLTFMVPEAEAATTLDVNAQCSATLGGAYATFTSHLQILAADLAAGAKVYNLPLPMPPGQPYLKVNWDTGGVIAVDGFGNVEAYITFGNMPQPFGTNE